MTAVTSKKRQIAPAQANVPTVDARRSGIIIPPIVDVGASGDARITNAAAAAALTSPVLKYGNPGMLLA